MTGVIAGSGGTGVLAGSRPGTGVQGGNGPVPQQLGAWTQDGTGWGSSPPTFVTPSVTARPGEALYLAFVLSVNASDQDGSLVGVSGLGLEWEPLVNSYFDPSTAGSIRQAIGVWFARGVATDGALTVTMGNTLARAAVSLLVVDGKPGLVGASNAASFTTALTVPALEGPPSSTLLIGAIGGYDATNTLPGFDPSWDTFDPTGYGFTEQGLQSGWVANDDDTTLDATWAVTSTGFAGVVVGVVATVPNYQAVVNSLSPSSQYPLETLGVAPDPDPYDTTILEMEASTYVKPGPFGTGADPDPYDTTIASMDQSTYVKPGPFGTGPDPDSYDTTVSGLDRSRWVPGDSIVPAAEQPNYNDLLLTLSPTRFIPGDRINELPGAIMALGPVGYFRMNEPGSTGVDTSGNGHDGTYSGDYTAQAEPGPDGFEYVHFLSDFVGDGHGGRLSVPTTAADGSFSPDGHGQTWVMLIKRDTPADLGYPIAKRNGSSTDREYDMSYSGGNWRADAFDVSNNAMMDTIAASPNTSLWELVVYRCPDLTVAAGDPFDIFVDTSTQLATSTADSSDGNYAATDSPLGIGGFPDTYAYGHNGAMAHVAVFDYELSDIEIQTLVDAANADGWFPPLEEIVLSTSPDSYWKLDDSTTTAVDAGTLGNDGTYGANVTLQAQTGPDGVDYPDFNGLSNAADLLVIPHNDAYLSETGPGLTVMCLVKSDDVSTEVRRNFILKDQAWWLRRFNDQPIFGNALANNNTGRQRTGAASLVEAQWALIISTTVDNTTFPDVYVDGTEIGGSDAGTSDGSTGTTGELRIGGVVGSYLNLDGSIAHVAIWNRVLTAYEIQLIADSAAANGWI